MTTPIVVVGGGHNGLTTAGLLAKRGHRVLVFEARDRLGGLAARETFHPGYDVPGILHDTGQVRSHVVRALGLENHGLEWREPAPIWVPSGSDGLWIEPKRVRGDVTADDAAHYLEHRAFIGRIAQVLGRVIDAPAPDVHGKLWPLFQTGWQVRKLGAADMTELLRVGPMPVFDWMHDIFENEHLRAALALPALDGAYMAPRSPGSSGNLLIRACTSHDEVLGGPAALTAALAKAALAHGAHISTGTRVTRVVLDGQTSAVRAVEVERADGAKDTIACSHVALSCDPKTALLDLVGTRHLPARLAHDIGNIRARGIVAKVHLALSGPLENRVGELLEHVRITGTLDDLERAFDAVKYGRFSEKPALDIRVVSAADPSLCRQEGHHVASIMVYFAPYDLRGGWTDDARAALERAVIARADEHLPGLAARIVASEVLTPVDLEARFSTSGGHLYHGDHALDQLLFMRPTIQCSHHATPIRGLFLCGSGSHPGGGLTCAPGALAADAIAATRLL